MRFWEFFHKPEDVSNQPNDTTDEPEQLTERLVVQQPKKKESNLNSPEGHCPRLDMYAQAIRRCINTRFISHAHKIAQNISQAQCNAIHVLKINRNI
eukprot:g44556.t1